MDGPTDPTLLIDGDIFLYRCGFAVEKTKYLVTTSDGEYKTFESAKDANGFAKNVVPDPLVWSRKEVEPVENAYKALQNSLKGVFDKFWPNEKTWKGKIYLTGKGNFREALDSGKVYKDNRDPAHRPKHYRAIKDYLVSGYNAKIVHGEEADDAIGRAAYSMQMDKYVIVSNDKDLDQLSGFHYDWTKGNLYFVTDEDALKNFYIQLLCGDATDNIPGIVSPALARKLIADCSSPHECARVAKAEYEKKYGEYWGDKIEVIGELVWIRRHDPDPDGRGLHNPFWDHFHAGA
jgi:5'-3' exonuclease